MSFKKYLRSKRSQSIVEYIVTFTVLAAGILVVFLAFNPENLGIRTVFNTAIDNAITEINRP